MKHFTCLSFLFGVLSSIHRSQAEVTVGDGVYTVIIALWLKQDNISKMTQTNQAYRCTLGNRIHEKVANLNIMLKIDVDSTEID